MPTCPPPLYTLIEGANMGSDPVYCSQGCVFATRGNGNREFFMYDIGESQWYSSTTIPSELGGPHYGGSMAYDTTTGYLFMLRGYNSDDFFKYYVSALDWEYRLKNSYPLDFFETTQED